MYRIIILTAKTNFNLPKSILKCTSKVSLVSNFWGALQNVIVTISFELANLKYINGILNIKHTILYNPIYSK